MMLLKLFSKLKGAKQQDVQQRHHTSKSDSDNQDDIYEEVFGDFVLVKEIGRGTSGTVYLAHRNNTAKLVQKQQKQAKKFSWRSSALHRDHHDEAEKLFAIKISCGDREQVLHEANILHLLNEHPSIVSFYQLVVEDKNKDNTTHAVTTNISTNNYDIHKKSRRFGLVMEYCEGGDLLTAIANTDGHGLDEEVARGYFVQILSAVQYMHSLGIAHCDIKPENIVLSQDKRRVFLTDFGLSTTSNCTHIRRGSIPYLAPELLLANEVGCNPMKCDVWACGILLYGMLTAHWPFHGETQHKALQEILKGDVSFPSNVFLGNLCKDLILSMLKKDPSQRPSVDEVFQHKYLAPSPQFEISFAMSDSHSECSSSTVNYRGVKSPRGRE